MTPENSEAVEQETGHQVAAPSSSFGAEGWIREDEVDTLAKSIAFQMQEILLNGFDSISHSGLAARVDALLGAMPSGRPLVIAMQHHLFEGDVIAAMHAALDLVDREHALMAAARARLAAPG